MLAVLLGPTAEGPRVSQDGTTILFGLPGVQVRHVERDDDAAAACPVCGVFSTSVRQRRTTRPRHLPYGEEPLCRGRPKIVKVGFHRLWINT